MKWKAILFDRDGTLFDSLAVILRSFNYAIEPFTDKRPGKEEWFAVFGPPEPKVLAHFVGAELQMKAFERFLKYYREHISEVILCEGVLKAMKLIRAKPQETLVIGDAASDVAAGKSAGATTVLARWCNGQPVDQLEIGPDFVFDDVSELEDFLFKTEV